MRTRSRLLLGFVAVHLSLSVIVGWCALSWVSSALEHQAEDRVRHIGSVLARFKLDQQQMRAAQELTGYQISLFDTRPSPHAGAVQIEVNAQRDVGVDGVTRTVTEPLFIEIDYRTAAYRAAQRQVIVGTVIVVLAGSLAFGVVALWLSRQFARPVEVLAAAARTIGGGDLDQPVPAVGSGEVVDLARDLDHMRVRIRDLDQQHRQAERLVAMGTFTATIAHEVRNPLTAVRLTVQMLAKRMPGDAGLELIGEELERLDLIVDEMLSFSRGMTVDMRPTLLRPLIDDVVRLLRRQADHAGVTVTVVGDAPGPVQADPARIRQLVMNLLINAIQAQHGGGATRIVIAADGLSVADGGPGIDPALVPRLFEPFVSNRSGGTGLGLHLAWTIAQAHGATLRYHYDGGAVFTLSGLKPAVSQNGGSSPLST